MCQMKIRQLEKKLQEEEHQRKLVQVQAHQVTTVVFLFSDSSIHSLLTACTVSYISVYCFTILHAYALCK